MIIQKYEGWTLCLAITSVILGEIASPKNLAFAQIQPDNTLGQNQSVVRENADNCNQCDLIEGGVNNGTNLFHSFEKFNVNRRLENGAVQSVYFSNPNGVERIFTRVTGQSRSEILGKLGVLGNADLFLINPNGIFFGPGASLDLRGSFIATTADSVVFENDSEFSARNPSNPALLTVNIPKGLQFRETAGDIINQSIAPGSNDFSLGLEVNSGKTLALIGGNITFLEGGVITAIDGRIELGSIASPGQVTLHPIEQGWTLSYEGIQNFQDINLTQQSQLHSLENGEDIKVTGRRITITGGSQIFQEGTKEITVTATDTVEIEGKVPIPGFPGLFSRSSISNQTVMTEDSGLVTINTRRLIIRDGGRLLTSTTGLLVFDEMGNLNFTTATGNGGNLIINATESVELTGNSTTITSQSQSFGDAGDITINTRNLSVKDGAIISAQSTGQTFVGEFIPTGKGGNININATESVQLNNGGIISVASLGMGKDAGNISIDTKLLNLNQGTITAQTNSVVGNPEGANIRLRVADIINLRNESLISATSTGTANGGNITIDTRFLIAYPPEGPNGSDITADSQGGAGGRIDITARGVFGTQRRDEFIPANTANQKNDITASSLNPNLNGVINFNTPDIDPTRGLIQFPTVVINPATLIEENYCIQQDVSQLVISGRGGLPPSIIENISDRAIEIELVKPVNSPETPPQNRTNKPKSTTQAPIIPARGWVYNKYGKVVLTAYDPTAKAFLPHRDKESVCPVQ